MTAIQRAGLQRMLTILCAQQCEVLIRNMPDGSKHVLVYRCGQCVAQGFAAGGELELALRACYDNAIAHGAIVV